MTAWATFALVWALATAAGSAPAASSTAKPLLPFDAPMPSLATLARGSANQNANLSTAECLRRLRPHAAAFKRQRRGASGIAATLRVVAPVQGVRFVVPPARSPFGQLDCRLALTLVDFAQTLTRRGVTEVRIDNFYRARARIDGKKKKSQHAYGLAIDIVSMRDASGQVLDVGRDFGQPTKDAPTCGEGAQVPPGAPKAKQLRDIVCDVGRSGAFHHILTPNYNAAHKSHLHLDIARGNRWFSVH